MNSVLISLAVFACTFGGALLGMSRRRLLPKERFSDDSIRVIGLATGMIVTMSAIVIGMLVSSAKSSYEVRHQELIEISSNILMLDRLLANYGPEAQDARSQLRSAVQLGLARTWGDSSAPRIEMKPSQSAEAVYDAVLALSPKDSEQSANKTAALRLTTDLQQMRWLLLVESGRESVSAPLLIILTGWLTAAFISFGLLAPSNSTVIAALLISALAVSTSIFLIVDMSDPFGGILKLSSEPLRTALEQLGK